MDPIFGWVVCGFALSTLFKVVVAPAIEVCVRGYIPAKPRDEEDYYNLD